MKNLKELFSISDTPFCIIQKQDNDECLLLEGKAHSFHNINDIPRKKGSTGGIRTFDSISVVPFCQVREKGYQARSNGEKILTLTVTNQSVIQTSELLQELPITSIEMDGNLENDYSETEYEEVIRHVLTDEIGNGEGANFVIPRFFNGKISDFSRQKALSIFRTLVSNDYGTYWKFIFFNGETYFVGSTPERHLAVEGQTVKMNPISGTFRKDKVYERRNDFKKDLLKFLNNPKEVDELFMVVDEELKMMSRMCEKGGRIIGPLLKEMSQLIHTEYILAGESDKDIFELFRESMFAATVVGSPVGNACNIIHKYSENSRRYYGSALMLVGRDKDGVDFLDSPITIRTAEISKNGSFHIGVGATLVKDSIPAEEVKETTAKSGALLNSILQKPMTNTAPAALPALANDDQILETLQNRNRTMSDFWFYKNFLGSQKPFVNDDISMVLIHNEDDFIYMLQHLFRALGIKTTIIPYQAYCPEKDTSTITLIGPGPGNPNDPENPKIQKNREIASVLLKKKKAMMGICLGHQILCKTLGFEVGKKNVPLQGVQEVIDLFGTERTVGFYNSFVPIYSDKIDQVECALKKGKNEMLAIKGSHFIGYQFHPESILTRQGDEILSGSISYLLQYLGQY